MELVRGSPLLKALGALAAAGAVAVLTYPRWRERCLTWGATEEEAATALPGDELLEDPDVVTTRAIGIGVTPPVIWPWLVQMGPGRAGAYTYDWIENLAGLDMHSADEILPQFQDLEVGDAWKLGAHGPLLRVASLDPPSTIVLRSDDGNWTWAFVLVPDAAGTRLLSRNRIRQPDASAATRAMTRYLMEPGSLVMERKMLLGIRQRAEGETEQTASGTAAQATPTRRHHAAPSSGKAAASG